MKKIIAIILTLIMVLSFAACAKKTDTNGDVDTNVNAGQVEENVNDEKDEVVADGEEKEEAKESEEPGKKPTAAPSENPQESTATPETTKKPDPTQAPTPAPEAPAASTLGTTLLADFKAKAASGMSAEGIANALLENPAIKFMGGAMPVEEGLLSGFDNTEIKGFKSGATFMPMIGSIPFVGYVFELENASDAPAFIKLLEGSANLRWNICVEAEEMVTGSSGNKVFFVMCPKSLEE